MFNTQILMHGITPETMAVEVRTYRVEHSFCADEDMVSFGIEDKGSRSEVRIALDVESFRAFLAALTTGFKAVEQEIAALPPIKEKAEESDVLPAVVCRECGQAFCYPFGNPRHPIVNSCGDHAGLVLA